MKQFETEMSREREIIVKHRGVCVCVHACAHLCLNVWGGTFYRKEVRKGLLMREAYLMVSSALKTYDHFSSIIHINAYVLTLNVNLLYFSYYGYFLYAYYFPPLDYKA